MKRKLTPARATRLASVAAAVAMSILAAGCGSSDQSSASGATKVPIAVATDSMPFAPAMVAFGGKIWAEHGIAATEQSMNGNAANTVAAVSSGKAKFGFANDANVLAAIEKGAPLQIIYYTSTGPWEVALNADIAAKLHVTAQSSLKDRVAALKGLKIATGPAGGSLDVMLRQFLSTNGLDPQKDVQVIPSTPEAIGPGLKAGTYQAGMWTPGPLEQDLTDGSVVPLIATAKDDPTLASVFHGVAFTTTKTIKDDPDLVTKVVDSLSDALSLMKNDQDKAKSDVYGKYFAPMDQKVFDLLWQNGKAGYQGVNGKISAADFKSSADFIGKALTGAPFKSATFENSLYKTARATQ